MVDASVSDLHRFLSESIAENVVSECSGFVDLQYRRLMNGYFRVCKPTSNLLLKSQWSIFIKVEDVGGSCQVILKYATLERVEYLMFDMSDANLVDKIVSLVRETVFQC